MHTGSEEADFNLVILSHFKLSNIIPSEGQTYHKVY